MMQLAFVRILPVVSLYNSLSGDMNDFMVLYIFCLNKYALSQLMGHMVIYIFVQLKFVYV